MSEANELTNKILDFLYRQKCYGWRSSSTVLFDPKLGKFRMSSKVGVSDVLAILPPAGKLLAIEIKIGTDRLRPEQIGFFRNVENVGGLTFVAKDFESFRFWFLKNVPHD